ncbi:MAG: hypothetical protein GXC76_08625 [Rhodanobacteraceae bacterium]|jgi:hypothetical protein|nr:hypothetical protein [Rhodanobacteraceae bacterium]
MNACAPSLRRAPLAAALLAGLFALADATAGATADTGWMRLRADPARRLFPALPGPRGNAPHAPATIRPVTTCADDGPGSLRAAVADAASGDTIDLRALTCGTITLATGAIPVRVDSLTLDGPGRGALTIDGNDADRVFLHPRGGKLTLHAVTVQRGRDRASGFDLAGGGCIASAGYVVLDEATVRNCYAGGEGAYGGGLYAYALTMASSTLSGNIALGVHESAGTAAFGGGAFVYAMELVASTVSGNRAAHAINPGRESYDIGGALVTVLGGSVQGSTIDTNYSWGRAGGIVTFNDVSITNSTLSGNVAANDIAGALLLRWPAAAQIANSTITANRAAAGGGGIWLATSGSRLHSSIVAGNAAGDPALTDLHGDRSIAIGGDHNLIGHAGPSVTVPPGTLATDPRLGPLAANGGPTRTHALQADSPAIDAGSNPLALAFDQRGNGYPRVHGAAADIGAFEQQAVAVEARPVPAVSRWAAALMTGLLALFAVARKRM